MCTTILAFSLILQYIFLIIFPCLIACLIYILFSVVVLLVAFLRILCRVCVMVPWILCVSQLLVVVAITSVVILIILRCNNDGILADLKMTFPSVNKHLMRSYFWDFLKGSFGNLFFFPFNLGLCSYILHLTSELQLHINETVGL